MALPPESNARIAAIAVFALLVWAGCWLAPPAAAQASPGLCPVGHSLHYGAAAGLDQARDTLLLPARFSGPGFAASGGYAYAGTTWCVGIDLGADAAPVWNTKGDPGVIIGSHWNVFLWLDVFRNHDWQLVMGPVFTGRTHNAFLYSWDDARTYWLGTLTLDVSAALHWQVTDSGRLSLRAQLPIIGGAGRPGDIRRAKQEPGIEFVHIFWRPFADLQFATWGDLASVETAVGYTWQWDAPGTLELTLRYDGYQLPRPVQRLTTSLLWTQWFSL